MEKGTLYVATPKFQDLGIDNSYQGLNTHEYYGLLYGKEVELRHPPKFLIENKYIQKVKDLKKVSK